ncbi:hypothetical protein FXO37_07299 [Capsicum annuum]|nr:hypothetical protein FXO37_07299 [Capsicum annuum]
MGSEKPGSDNGEKRVYQDKEEMKLWGIFIFALIGATATTFASYLVGGGKYSLELVEVRKSWHYVLHRQNLYNSSAKVQRKDSVTKTGLQGRCTSLVRTLFSQANFVKVEKGRAREISQVTQLRSTVDFVYSQLRPSGVDERCYGLRGSASSSYDKGKEVATSTGDEEVEDDEHYVDTQGIEELDNLNELEEL